MWATWSVTVLGWRAAPHRAGRGPWPQFADPRGMGLLCGPTPMSRQETSARSCQGSRKPDITGKRGKSAWRREWQRQAAGPGGSLTSLVAEGGQARQSGRQISERHVCQAQGAFGKAGGPDWVCLRRQTHLQRPGPPAAGTPPPSSASGNGSAQSDHHRHALRTRGWSEVGEVQSGELALTMVS